MESRCLTCLLWAVILAMSSRADDSFVCDVPPTDAPGGPPMPTITASIDYQARVEVNILDKNYTMIIDEFLDYYGNRGRMNVYRNGQKDSIIYSYSTDEVFDIKDLQQPKCTVYTLDNDPYRFIFGQFTYNATDTDKRHIFGSGAALRFARNSQDIYIGSTTVRGIPADIWTACIDWPNTQGKVQAKFYFSQQNWNMSGPLMQIPLRIEVEGVSTAPTSNAFNSGSPSATTAAPSAPRHFHHIYEYVNYLPYLDEDPVIFETPSGIVCENRRRLKDPPQIGKYFRYRAEVVDPANSVVTHYSVWYDEDYKLLREDTVFLGTNGPQNIPSPPPLNLGDHIEEIHDFNTGIRYMKDRTSGLCTSKPLDTNADDSLDTHISRQFNGTVIVNMKDPNSFFRTNNNFTYTGQRTIRGINCDIFISNIPNFVVEGLKANATYEYAFVSTSWNDVPGNGYEADVQNFPVQLVVSAPLFYYTRIYNFYDFTEEHVLFRDFDISTCFDDAQKIGFKLTFPGTYVAGTEEVWHNVVYTTLAEAMQILPIRVSGISVSHDADNIFVSGVILGSPNLAQFERDPALGLERDDDKVYHGITNPDECAQLCLTNTDFSCDGFQWCPDNAFACRLSQTHGATKNVTKNATACDDFSRTVQVPVLITTLTRDAYTNLEQSVRNKFLSVQISNPDGSMSAPFVAINVELTSGMPVKYKPLPSLPSSFFYRLETVIPGLANVLETFVWYDQDMHLVRYDTRDPTSRTPYMTTQIHDFSTGVAYTINQVTEECTVAPIAAQGAFDVGTGTLTNSANGSFVISMQSPYGIFFLDDTYTYVGQSTARGILCDVFESRRNDFDLRYYNISGQQTVFKFYFMADDWDYAAVQSTKSTRTQPVQLMIEDSSTGTFMSYNFFDFTEQHFASSFYDTTVCYDADERQNFVVTFKNQPFHPTLDGLSNTFLNTAVMMLAENTMTSPIRFQSVSVTNDDFNIYLIGTILGNVSPLALFTPVMHVARNAADAGGLFALSAGDCATSCVEMNSMICNSFDYCQPNSQSTVPNCALGAKHAESEGNNAISSGDCIHYSRTEDGSTYPMETVSRMYQVLTDYVYDDKFQVPIILLNGTKVTFIATDIRNDVLLPTDPDSTAGSYLKQFVITPSVVLNDSMIAVEHDMVSITDCAGLCLQENTFLCQSFDYQFETGTCRLSNIHPDEMNGANPGYIITKGANVYAKFYTAEYHKYDAEVIGANPDKLLQSVQSDEMCARACTYNTDFRCESFEICNDGSCRLRKTHILEVRPENITVDMSCTHYSRNHLFDYIERKNKELQGHDDSQAKVTDVEECAHLCANGDGLLNCASFEVCQPQRGEIICTFSTADPTSNQTNLVIVDKQGCSLYTRANPMPAINNIPGQTVTPGKNTVTSTTSKPTTTQATTKTSQSPVKSTAKPTSPTPFNQPTRKPSACPQQSGASGPSSDDIGTRVGIAFGTLFLGLAVGAVCMFFIMRWKHGRGNQEDSHMLKTWSS